jgi:hypothetical protein
MTINTTTDLIRADAELALKATLDSIARTHFPQLRDRADPMAIRNSDSHDFIDTAIWAIREALEEAYQRGWADAEVHHRLQDLLTPINPPTPAGLVSSS